MRHEIPATQRSILLLILHMNKYVAFALLLGLLSDLSWSCKNTQKSRKAHLQSAPPGTNHLFENYFIDETEVTNLSWREYMYWTKRAYGAESPQFKSTLPDTLVWKNCYKQFTTKRYQDHTAIESLVYLYLRHPSFSQFPIVGISFEQAVRFCEWRTNRVNEVFYVNKHKEVTFPIDSSIVIPKRVFFRLPTEEEWEYAARAGYDSTKQSGAYSDKIYYNTLEASSIREISESYDRFTPMQGMSLQPDKYNRYHFTGNVAELISEKGIAKGGSFIHSMKESYYKNRIAYNAPDYWLGFRCICEILPYQE